VCSTTEAAILAESGSRAACVFKMQGMGDLAFVIVSDSARFIGSRFPFLHANRTAPEKRPSALRWYIQLNVHDSRHADGSLSAGIRAFISTSAVAPVLLCSDNPIRRSRTRGVITP
jgi:hypothetical protein